MENRIRTRQEVSERGDRRSDGPQPIGVILAELLAQYQVRFPEVHVALVETPATVF